MRRTRLKPRRETPRRKRPEIFGSAHGLKLYGAAKTEQRRKLFGRSKGRCEDTEETVIWRGVVIEAFQTRRCNAPITWDSMEWSHKRHGSHRCDCLECGIASCKECHRRRHNPKAVPKKPVLNGGSNGNQPAN